MTSVNASHLGEVKITDRFDLSNNNFLITGGGRGIGFACAKAIAQLGGGVAVIDTAAQPVEEFNTLSERYNVKTLYTQADVTNKESLEEAFAQSVHSMGQLHGGLTAAGIVMDTPLLEADWEVTQHTLNVNVLGTYWTVKLLAEHLVNTKSPGSIVAISSMNGQGLYVPVQPKSAYNASKAAIKGLIGPLAGELGQYGIRVNCVSPGESASDNSKEHR
jgi:NAD(P)-dependent dehydrogenase (short-subunit alcohol dehydrogenase family)